MLTPSVNQITEENIEEHKRTSRRRVYRPAVSDKPGGVLQTYTRNRGHTGLGPRQLVLELMLDCSEAQEAPLPLFPLGNSAPPSVPKEINETLCRNAAKGPLWWPPHGLSNC